MSDLTDHQRGIASLVRCGLKNREIAAVLNIAPGSVANTLGLIYRKLGITGAKGARRTKLAVMVVEGRNPINPPLTMDCDQVCQEELCQAPKLS